ncbi:MAG: gluconokinase [Dehalococcoidia bacterium]
MPKTSETQGPLVLTLDVGTSSVRAMIWDRQGNWLPGLEAEIEHSMTTTADGGVETDPETLFKRTAKSIDAVLDLAGTRASSIGAVGISTFWHSLIGVDSAGTPQTPLYTWADTRSRKAAEELKRRLDERQVHGRTGCMIHTSYLPAKLLWLSQEHADVFARVRSWMSFGEYLFLKLFDRPVVSLSMASGTGLFDQDTSTWDAPVLEALPINVGQLGQLVDANTGLSGLKKKWANRWPALRDVAWYPALGDGACSNVGSNCSRHERMGLMIGTSGAIRVLWKANGVPAPEGLWRYRLDAEHIVVGGAISNGGNLVRWLNATLNLGKKRESAQQIAALAPDSHGLTVLPYLAGERSPGYRGDARAAWTGLSLHTTPQEIARASLESVSYSFAQLHDLLIAVAPAATEIVVNGGAILKRPYWMQITADVLGQRLIASSEAEATSRGAALMALQSLGEIAAIEDAPDHFGDAFGPDRDHYVTYQQAAASQRKLYDLLLNVPGSPVPSGKGGQPVAEPPTIHVGGARPATQRLPSDSSDNQIRQRGPNGRYLSGAGAPASPAETSAPPLAKPGRTRK